VNPDSLPEFSLLFCIVLLFSDMATAGEDASTETQNDDEIEIYQKMHKLL